MWKWLVIMELMEKWGLDRDLSYGCKGGMREIKRNDTGLMQGVKELVNCVNERPTFLESGSQVRHEIGKED